MDCSSPKLGSIIAGKINNSTGRTEIKTISVTRKPPVATYGAEAGSPKCKRQGSEFSSKPPLFLSFFRSSYYFSFCHYFMSLFCQALPPLCRTRRHGLLTQLSGCSDIRFVGNVPLLFYFISEDQLNSSYSIRNGFV